MKPVTIKIKLLNKSAKMPTGAYQHSAAWDVYSIGYNVVEEDGYGFIEYSTGISMEFPKNYVVKLFPRSSVSNTGLILSNCVGIVDPDYRGEIKFRFKYIPNTNIYSVGDRIGQLRLERTIPIKFEQVDELSDTDRGKKGFGSTNK